MKTLTDAQRMAIKDAQDPYFANRNQGPSSPPVSADARYIVQWMLAIFVLLPLAATLMFILFR